MAIKLLERIPRQKALVGTETVSLIYTALTTLVLLFVCERTTHPADLLLLRGLIIGGGLLTYALHYFLPTRGTLLLRYIYPLTLLAVWYPDTYEFCQLFTNLDPYFAQLDQWFFACQHSLEFSQWLPEKIWSELFHMGYWAYYPMIFLTILAPLFGKHPERFPRTAFMVLSCFFLYYFIYLFVPVAGPQYYFCAVGIDTIEQGIFPAVGEWFRTHTEMLPSPGPEGLFRSLVIDAQTGGERPTAAFPSSHVGISTILMLLLWLNQQKKLLCLLLPFYVLLCCATVYIQAHYLVDVFGGWITAVIFFFITLRLFPFVEKVPTIFRSHNNS